MNKSLLFKLSTTVFLAAMPMQAIYAANITVPSWAYDSVQTLAQNDIISLPPGVNNPEQAQLNRKDMAILVVRAINSLKDKKDYDNRAGQKSDSINVAAKADIYNSEIVKVDALKMEFDKELRDLGMKASYVASSTTISKEADADTLAKNKKYSFLGEARYSYSNNSGDNIAGYRQSRLRLRLYGAAKLNYDWSALVMLEANNYFLNNNRGETDWTNLDRYYLHGLIGTTTLDIGRFGYNIADGNVYDTGFNGISATFGGAIKYKVIAGETSDKGETYGIAAKYRDFDYDVEVGAYSFGVDKWNSAKRKIVHGGMNYYFDNCYLGAVYLHSDLEDINGNKDGYIWTFSYGGLETWKKGTYELRTRYYRQPVGTYVVHTMNGLSSDLDGFKGLGFSFYYTIHPNVVAGLEYYRLSSLISDKKANTLWGQISYYF